MIPIGIWSAQVVKQRQCNHRSWFDAGMQPCLKCRKKNWRMSKEGVAKGTGDERTMGGIERDRREAKGNDWMLDIECVMCEKGSAKEESNKGGIIQGASLTLSHRSHFIITHAQLLLHSHWSCCGKYSKGVKLWSIGWVVWFLYLLKNIDKIDERISEDSTLMSD